MDHTRPRIVLLLLLAVITVGVYLPSLRYGLIYEDRNGGFDGLYPTDLPIPALYDRSSDRVDSLGTLFFRDVHEAPMRSLLRWSFQVTTYAFDRRAVFARVVNLGLHLCNGGLLALLLLPNAVSLLPVALIGLFWLHPLQLETVAYLAGGRGELLMTMGVLVALLGAQAWPRSWGILLACVGTLMALLSKEAAVSLIVLLPLAQWYRQPSLASARWLLLPAALVGLLACSYASLARFAWRHQVESWALHLGQQCAALWRLLLLVVWPVGQSIDHGFGSIGVLTAVVAFGGLLALVPLAWSLRGRWPAFTFITVWTLACALPRLLLPSTEFLTEHHCYLPMAGMAIGLATRKGVV